MHCTLTISARRADRVCFSTKLGVAFAAVALLTSCWEGTTRAVSATILATKGTVRIKQRLSAEFLPAQPGLALGAGTVLQTAEATQVDLALLPNALTRLLSGGELTIDSLKLSEDGNETGDGILARRVAISLREGTLFLAHRRPPGSAGTLQVSTPHGTIVSNSDCLIYIETSSRRLRVGCISGSVEIASTSGQKALLVDAGFVVESTPQTSTLMEAAGDAAAQQEITEAISAERELLALVRRQRDILH
jgi:hypothetical protein